MDNQIKKHFDRSIKTYKNAAIVQKRVAARCYSHVPKNNYSRVLEIGAGGGFLTESFLQGQSSFGMYIALDVSRMMLKLVPMDRVVRLQADGEKTPFRQGCFSLLLSSSAMQWYQEGSSSIINNIRLLERGGFFSLAIFVQGTFIQMSHASSLSGFGSVYPLPSAGTLLKILKPEGRILESDIEEYRIHFPSVHAFLQTHKQTGANYSRQGACFSRKAYNEFCRIYKNMYGEEQGIPVSYKVLYLWGRR
jgi:malonyl-CoA O-methyltransferase